jgi:L-ascorbate metabolism protein UlaG (beta-lactamase superfamily)
MEEEAEMVKLSDALKELDAMLEREAKGYSLQPLYEKIPDMLKGCVELVYDLQGNPTYRLIEPLLYHRYYREEAQSIALWLTTNDERPFVLSTPRLESDEIVHLNIPFNHKGIDELAKMKHQPGSIERVRDLLGIPPEKYELFSSFFTKEKPRPYEKYEGDKIKMRYFGHACILVETKDVSILVDPLISYYGYPQDVNRFSEMDLPEVIDYVLITHNHQDHILFETLLPLRHKIKNVVVPRNGSGFLQDPNLRLMFEAIGFENVIELDEMQAFSASDATITGVPFMGEHGDLNIRTKLCYHVKIGEFTMLFVADSCNVEPHLYEIISELTGDIQIIFLGMECDGAPGSWLYGPLMSQALPRDKDESRRLNGSNYERAKALVDQFNPQEVYVYAMGMEPWLEFISSIKYTDESHPIVASNNLIQYCHLKGWEAERLFGEKELLYSKQSAMATT